MALTQINAPYNFVPLSDTVVTPEWADLVSHDLPFKDGISGELELRIEALSPIMIGGEQQQGTERESGQVKFFKTLKSKEHPQGQYAIPGSSLRGAIRNVFEIATFSKMNRIDNKRYGLRDISTQNVSNSYGERVRGNVKYAFMYLENGEPCLQPCSMLRLSHRILENEFGVSKPIFKARMTVNQKYSHWSNECRKKGINDTEIAFKNDGQDVTGIDKSGQSGIKGFPVFTGQISDSTRKNGKYKDFVFHSPSSEKIVISEADSQAWENFLFVHGDESGKREMSWPGHWKAAFRSGQKVPVFYIQSQDRLHIGLAYMPKLAGDFSTHDMLKHTHEDHLDSEKHDLTSIVFGQVSDSPSGSIKSRVSFEPAVLVSKVNVNNQPQDTILNGAKPSYFPNYIYQKTNQFGNLADSQYATYIHSITNSAPELRGWKRYPVRPQDEVAPQPLGQKQTKKVQTRLYTLEEGATFKTRMVFHNLQPVELGALLWSVELENKRHSLGMGKSFGFGQVKITANWNTETLRCNNTDNSVAKDSQTYIDLFKSYMSEELENSWDEATPIKALLAMSDLECRDMFKGKLKHMRLENRNNEFTAAKQSGYVLQGYVDDVRTLKRRSHVVTLSGGKSGGTTLAESEKEVWEDAKIHFQPGQNRITASKVDSAILDGDEAKAIFSALSGSAQRKAKKGLLTKSVIIKRRGNECIFVGFND